MNKIPGFSVPYVINLHYILTVYEDIYVIILTQSVGCLHSSQAVDFINLQNIFRY